MSFIYRDNLGPKTARTNSYGSLFRRFDGSISTKKKNEDKDKECSSLSDDICFFEGAWGSEYVGKTVANPIGIEVYDEKLRFFRKGKFRIDEPMKRFITALGMDWNEFISQDISKEIDHVWFEFKGGFAWDGSTRFDGTYAKKDWDFTDPNSPNSPKFTPTAALVAPSNADLSDSINDIFAPDTYEMLPPTVEEPSGASTLDEDDAPYEGELVNTLVRSADVIEVTITYGGALKRYINEHSLEWIATGVEIIPPEDSTGFDSVAIRKAVLSNPWYYLANSRHKPYYKNSNQFQTYNAGDYNMPQDNIKMPSDRKLPACDVQITVPTRENSEENQQFNFELGLFALMDNGTMWEPFLDDTGEVSILDQRVTTVSTNTYTDGYKDTVCPDDSPVEKDLRCDGEALQYSFTLKFKFLGSTAGSFLVSDMRTWYSSYYQNPADIPKLKTKAQLTTNRYKEDLTTSTIDTKFKKSLVREMENPAAIMGANSLYYDGQLRVDAVKSMKLKDFSRLISSKMETDQKAAPQGGGLTSRIIQIVIIIAAIAITIYTAGAAAPGTSAMLTASYALAAGSAALAVGMMIGSTIGLLNSSDMKLIGTIAEVTGYAAMATGIAAAYQAAVKQLAAEAVTEAAKEAAVKGAIDGSVMSASEVAKAQASVSFVSVVGQMAINAFSSVMNMGAMEVAMSGLKVVDTAVGYQSEKDQTKHEDKMADKQDELAGLNQKLYIDSMNRDVSVVVEAPFSDATMDRITELDEYIKKMGPDYVHDVNLHLQN